MSHRNVTSQPAIGHQTASTALEAGRQIKSQPATLISLLASNTGSAQYIQLHDSATAPSAGAAPLFFVKVGADATVSLDTPIKFTNGIYVTNSSTPDTFTVGSANCWFVSRDL
jgi:hypothetical protein